jgi:hypothetical protein
VRNIADIVPFIDEAVREKFLGNISAPDPNGCTHWLGAIMSAGYGIVSVNRRSRLCHRVAYIIEHGSIAAGMLVCHRCDVRSCCNPKHLFLGSSVDNAVDMMQKGRARGTAPFLSAETVGYIRRMRQSGWSCAKIARKIQAGRGVVWQADTGKTYAHIPMTAGTQ